MKKYYRFLTPALIGAVILSMAGCSGKEEAETTTTEPVIPFESTVYESTEPTEGLTLGGDDEYVEYYTTMSPEESETSSVSPFPETTATTERKTTTTTKPVVSSTKPSTSAAKPTTTAAKTKATKETTLRVLQTKQQSKDKKTTKLKHGVVKNEETVITFEYYSNGSRKETKSETVTSIDSSAYKASTADLLTEANANKSLYASDTRKVAEIINSARAAAGVEELTFDSNLCTAASVRAAEMAWTGKTAQNRPDGSKSQTVLADLKIEFTNYAEISATGNEDGAVFGKALSEKSGVLKPEFKKIGVGLAQGPDGEYYWCVIFTY